MFAYFRAPLSWRELASRTVDETLKDGCPGLAAQLAFYFMLAIFPALLFLVALLSYLPVDAALAPMLGRLDAFVPSQMIGLIRGQLEQVAQGAGGGLLTFGIASAIWSSSAAMSAISTALNRAYDIEEGRSWWKVRLLAISLTIALALFIVTAFGLVIGGSSLAAWIARQAGLGYTFEITWALLQWPLVLLLVIFAVNLVYHFAPNAEIQWQWLTPGSMLATLLWLLVSLGFKVYVQTFGNYAAVYGTIGGVIVLMLWLYLSSFALLIGAELNAVIVHALAERDDDTDDPKPKKKKSGPRADVDRR